MFDVAELQHFCNRRRRNWTVKEDVVNERGVVVADSKMLAPYPPHILSGNRKMYTKTTAYEEMYIKVIMDTKRELLATFVSSS